MSHSPFVHLHVHSEYSLLDGAIRTKELVQKALEFNMPAVALTDHGNLYGAIEFYQNATAAGIKPIIGCEMYVSKGSMHQKSRGQQENAHLTLLATNQEGYHNLIKLSTAAHLEGFYYKPRIDKELLAQHSKGLIALSGCLKGEINMALSQHFSPNALTSSEDYPEAQALTAQYRDIFGKENFFIELSDHGIEAQRRNRTPLLQLAKEFELGVVATNDVHFLERTHHQAHDVMICIGTGSMVADEKRMHYLPELYFKSAEEMAALFQDRPDAISNTVEIASRCDLTIDFSQSRYPHYNPPNGKSGEEFLYELCLQGLEERYGAGATSDIKLQERLDFEFSVLKKTGFISYFLIVWDFIDYAKKRHIPVGPGRGSAAGSLIAYVLGITNLDPLEYGLLFERFLNPDRISPPDIDIDFCPNRRSEVIDYVRNKYGERAVSQIITFGTLGAKSVVRDVGRVLGWSYSDADRIAKMIPNELNITLNGTTKKGKHIPGAIDKNQELKEAIEKEESTAQLWSYASILEGLARNSGVHAAGVVIADHDLSEDIPLTRSNDGSIVSQYSMAPLTDLGLLKMDFLGLKTLTVIQDAVDLIQKKVTDFSIEKIPLNDQATFDLLNRGESIGIFQLESGGMTNVAKRLQIDALEDIIALVALYRPGPMQFIDEYIGRKKGERKIHYAHPLLEEVCRETYGIILYQEQVQKAANLLAGYTLAQADLLRRAMGKKDKEKMAKERLVFVKGCQKLNQIPEKQAHAIFDFLEKFAEYGFNKSHSAAYALISYQTAYLKANYPLEFMASLLSNEINNTDKIATLVNECSRMAITILPPDINKSGLIFLPEQEQNNPSIRYGLAAIKNVGEAAMELAIAERKSQGVFSSLENFCQRLDSRSIHRKILESLIKAGAFDMTDSEKRSRAKLFEAIDRALASANSLQRDRASGQISLFDVEELLSSPKEHSYQEQANSETEWPLLEQLAYEKELLGFYVTGHPLDRYQGALEKGTLITIEKLLQELETSGTTARGKIGGLITSIEKKFTKKEGKPFAILEFEDYTGHLECTVWNEAFSENEELLQPGNVIACNIRITLNEATLRATASYFKQLQPIASKKPIHLPLQYHNLSPKKLQQLQEYLQLHRQKYPGKRSIVLDIETSSGKILQLQLGKKWMTDEQRLLQQKVRELI